MPPRLLIIDDELQFAHFVQKVAEGLGYDVTAESSPKKFREAYLAAPVDVLVLDIVMPEEDGFDLLRWLVQQDCAAKVVLMTGFNPNYATSAKTIAEAQSKMSVSVLQKPVRLAELRAALTEGTHAVAH